MAKQNRITVEVSADTKDYERDIDKATKKTDEFKRSTDKLDNAAQDLGNRIQKLRERTKNAADGLDDLKGKTSSSGDQVRKFDGSIKSLVGRLGSMQTGTLVAIGAIQNLGTAYKNYVKEVAEAGPAATDLFPDLTPGQAQVIQEQAKQVGRAQTNIGRIGQGFGAAAAELFDVVGGNVALRGFADFMEGQAELMTSGAPEVDLMASVMQRRQVIEDRSIGGLSRRERSRLEPLNEEGIENFIEDFGLDMTMPMGLSGGPVRFAGGREAAIAQREQQIGQMEMRSGLQSRKEEKEQIDEAIKTRKESLRLEKQLNEQMKQRNEQQPQTLWMIPF